MDRDYIYIDIYASAPHLEFLQVVGKFQAGRDGNSQVLPVVE